MDAATWANFATAAGTLALAIVTVVSLRSSNRAARVSERNMLASLRPLLLPSKLQDVDQKIGFMDDHWVKLGGSRGSAEVEGEVIYLCLSVRNAGAGLALMHGWMPVSDGHAEPARPEVFRRLTRDLYVAGGDVGFWQGAIRDSGDRDFDWLQTRVKDRTSITIDILYGDQEGSQRTISRFSLIPFEARTPDAGDVWLASVSRHWYPDREDPR